MRLHTVTSGIGGIGEPAPGTRTLSRYCRDLRHLIYWMENDRSLGARPGKIRELRQMLTALESQLSRRTAIRKFGPTMLPPAPRIGGHSLI